MRINFCGDSFCADTGYDSWVSILSAKLSASIVGTGVKGSCHEIAIESFNPKADVTVFTWTHHSRIHNKKKYPMNHSSVRRGTLDIVPNTNEWKAGYAFYKYLYEDSYFRDRQFRDLYWFDREVLSKYKKPIIHLWCFGKNYAFLNGKVQPEVLRNSFSYTHHAEQSNFPNHMSPADNKKLSKIVLSMIEHQL